MDVSLRQQISSFLPLFMYWMSKLSNLYTGSSQSSAINCPPCPALQQIHQFLSHCSNLSLHIVWIITNFFPQHSTSNSCTQQRRKITKQNEKVARVIFMARYTFFFLLLHSNTSIFEIHGKITKSMLNISFKKLHSTEIEFPDNNSPDDSKNRKH